MTEQTTTGLDPDSHPANLRPVEVRGQVRAVQMDPPNPDDEPEGGAFQLLLDNGDIIVSSYPAKWHIEVAGAFQANDVRRAVVTGIGEYSPDGRLQRIRELKSFAMVWAD
ncbi:MAG: hypothetical protein OXI54_00090 [Chloroflexota bacterium]|nr:hypothetical protein [Chloroflexota bacterium]MDE2682538.1 hypothetical protein [Chloroflexota bacterium]